MFGRLDAVRAEKPFSNVGHAINTQEPKASSSSFYLKIQTHTFFCVTECNNTQETSHTVAQFLCLLRNKLQGKYNAAVFVKEGRGKKNNKKYRAKRPPDTNDK